SVKEHGVVTTALSSGTQVCCITEHLSQRNETADHLTAADIVHTFDTSTTGVDITDNITHVVFRCGNFDLHDRLKQYRCGFLHSFLERQRTSDVECHLRRVDLMIRTIVYVCMNAYYRESAKDTSSHSLFDTLADCRDILLRNSTADNGRFELIGFLCIRIHRLKFNFTVTVLSTSTGLFCVLAVNVSRLCDGLFVSNLRSTNVCLYLELTKQTVNDDLQMKLTHTSDDGLSSLLVGMCTEGRIFLCKFCKGLTQ